MKKLTEEKITPIYSGKPNDFCWAGFGSGSGTNLRECAKVAPPKLIFSDRPGAKLLSLEELANVQQIVVDGYKACGSWKKAQGNPEAEAEYKERSVLYNQRIVGLLKQFEEKQGKPIDLIVLGGYMRLVGEPLLEAYPDKIINVHPADLSILNYFIGHSSVKHNMGLYQIIHHLGEKAGLQTTLVDDIDRELEKKPITVMRKFTGEDAVYDAVKAGQTATRSSVIIVDAGEDHGEMLTIGPSVNVWPEYVNGTPAEREECLREYADAHQSFQKVRSDWPALTTALRLIAEGRLALGTEKTWFNEWRAVYVDGKKMPYQGFEAGGE